MFKLIVVIYFFSGSGEVALHSFTVRDDYQTKDICETAAKEVLKNLSVPSTSFEKGAAFKAALLRHSCS